MFLKEYDYSSGYNKKKIGYSHYYAYWTEMLFDYAMKIFSWEGLPESIPAKEIELRLLLYGKAGFFKYNGKHLVADVSLEGITDYYDEFLNFIFTTPKASKRRKIGKDGILMSNNSLRNGIYPLIHFTASQLAHTDVSINCALVNGRDVTAYKVISDKHKSTVQAYRAQIWEGKMAVLTDPGMATTEQVPLASDHVADVGKLMDLKNNILNGFFENIGVRRANEKRERLVVDEVSANNGLLKLNLKDMFESRQKAAEEINAMFGLSIKPICNVDLDGDGAVDPEGTEKKREESDDNENLD